MLPHKVKVVSTHQVSGPGRLNDECKDSACVASGVCHCQGGQFYLCQAQCLSRAELPRPPVPPPAAPCPQPCCDPGTGCWGCFWAKSCQHNLLPALVPLDPSAHLARGVLLNSLNRAGNGCQKCLLRVALILKCPKP